MPTINLAKKFETKLDNQFTHSSFTDAAIGKDYNWQGVNAITVWDLVAGALADYDASAAANRFGTPSEVDDHATTYTLSKKRSFAKVFDATNVDDSMFIRKATAYLKQMWEERYIPERDKYRLSVWADGAGQGTLGATLTKSTVIEAILKAHAALDDALVPNENRFTFVRSDIAVQTKLAAELQYSENFTNRSILRGQIGEINGSPIISVPKSYMPADVEFIVKYKGASADPDKMKMLRANDNAPGYAGVLMEGLCRYDAFVLANKADGIYVYGKTGGSVLAAPVVASYASGTLTLTTTGGETYKYTKDGSNPKTNASAIGVTATGTTMTITGLTSGNKVRIYKYASGKTSSPIVAYDVA